VCRWIRPIRRSVWATCWKTARRRCFLTGGTAGQALSGLADGLAAKAIPTLDLVEDAGAWANRSDANPAPADVGLRPDHLAYVIYTSGSNRTAQRRHDRARGDREPAGLDAKRISAWRDDVVLQKNPVQFRRLVWEFFWPLLHGAKLAMARPEGHKDSNLSRQCHRARRRHHPALCAIDAAGVLGTRRDCESAAA